MNAHRNWIPAPAAAALFVLTVALGCGGDQTTNPGGDGDGGGITVPTSWAGTWQITTQTEPGTRGTQTDYDVSPICAGMEAGELFFDVDSNPLPITVSCTGTWDDTDADVTCTARVTLLDCEVTGTMHLVATRTGDSFEGTSTLTVLSNPPGCSGEIDTTETSTLTGQRLNLDQFGCDPDLEATIPSDWGGHWAIDETPRARPGRGAPALFCPGLPATDGFAPAGIEIASFEGGFAPDGVTLFYSFTEMQPPCAIVHTSELELVRADSVFTGTRTQVDYTLGPSGSGCSGTTTTIYDVQGSRLDTDTTSCPTFGVGSPLAPGEPWALPGVLARPYGDLLVKR